MTIPQAQKSNSPDRGFSLLEILVVVGIISIVLGAILTQVNQLQQRATTEEGRVDDFQQARDFMDQIFRDTRQMGYPNVHNYDTTVTPSAPAVAWQSPLSKDSRIAVGLVKLTPTELDFEGDVDGSGKVSIVSFKVNGSGGCANCIQRAQVYKGTGPAGVTDPVTQVTGLAGTNNYSVEVQNVQNSTAIFTAYNGSGAAVNITGGIDFNNNAALIDSVRVIQAQLKIASPTAIDPKTGMQLEADIEGRVQVVNCSMAQTGQVTQYGIQLTCQ